MRSMSPESNQVLSLSQRYIDASLKKIHALVQKIFYLQDYDLENEVKVTKSNQLLILSQRYIDASLKKIHILVQKIFYLQDYDLENEVKVTKI